MDRLLPLGVPVTNLKNGHSNHPSRRIIPESKVVLVSSCGFYEKDNFNATVYHIKAFCKNVDREFAGALIRPHAWVVNKMPNDIIKAAKEAGRQLIKERNGSGFVEFIRKQTAGILLESRGKNRLGKPPRQRFSSSAGFAQGDSVKTSKEKSLWTSLTHIDLAKIRAI